MGFLAEIFSSSKELGSSNISRYLKSRTTDELFQILNNSILKVENASQTARWLADDVKQTGEASRRKWVGNIGNVALLSCGVAAVGFFATGMAISMPGFLVVYAIGMAAWNYSSNRSDLRAGRYEDAAMIEKEMVLSEFLDRNVNESSLPEGVRCLFRILREDRHEDMRNKFSKLKLLMG